MFSANPLTFIPIYISYSCNEKLQLYVLCSMLCSVVFIASARRIQPLYEFHKARRRAHTQETFIKGLS